MVVEKVANNPSFNETWEQLQKQIGTILSMSHSDNVEMKEWHEAFDNCRCTMYNIQELAKIKR